MALEPFDVKGVVAVTKNSVGAAGAAGAAGGRLLAELGLSTELGLLGTLGLGTCVSRATGIDSVPAEYPEPFEEANEAAPKDLQDPVGEGGC